MNTYPRETVEHCALVVEVDGTPVTAYEVCLTADGARPGVWASNVELDGKHGFMVQALTKGTHSIWVRVTDNPETPVMWAGYITIT